MIPVKTKKALLRGEPNAWIEPGISFTSFDSDNEGYEIPPAESTEKSAQGSRVEAFSTTRANLSR
jgi:hypothetical protein